MEIDIFPIPSKKGIHRYLGPAMLGLLVISYVVGATLLARRLVGIDNEMFCFLVAVLLFIGGYALFILLLHGIKQCLYSYFKSNRKELNNRIERENLDSCIVKHLEEIQKKLDKAQTIAISQRNTTSPTQFSTQKFVEENAPDDELQPDIMPELKQKVTTAQHNLAPFLQQLHIDRIQLTKVKEKHDKEKLASILRYTRLVFLPHGFSDEELYQIEEAIKLLVECNGIVNCVSVKIKKNKLKQGDLKNFVWNIGYQYDIDADAQAKFVLSLFHSWFEKTEKETIRKTLRNTKGKFSIEIDENIIDHLPELEKKVLGKKSE